MRKTTMVVNGVLAVIVLAVVAFGLQTVFHKSTAKASPRTATVTRGTVQETVTASGNVSSADTSAVNFATSGTLTEVDATVGETVTAGQVLGKIDPTQAQAALNAAEDSLTAANDNLAIAQGGNETPPQQAQDAFSMSTAQTQVNNAQTALATAEATQTSDATTLQAAYNAAFATLQANIKQCAANPKSFYCTAAQGPNGSAFAAEASALNALNNAATKDAQSVASAQSAVTSASNNLTSTQLSINTKQYVSPSALAQDQAAVAQAQSTVNQDQKTLAETTITAPIAGTITAVSGSVGGTVSASGTTTTASAGTGTSSGTGTSTGGGTGGTGASATSSSSSSSTSSSSFVTIADTTHLVVAAAFAEADASKVAVKQPATVTLSALPSTTVTGAVTAVSPTATVTSNVVTYVVTIALTNPPADVKSGMTAETDVVVDSLSNVLELPTSAITTTGPISTVTVVAAGKEHSQTVTVGLKGDSTTQILTGLTAGQVVVQPTATVSTTAGATGTGATGTGAATRAGGFGGGGFGGGGFGG
jgi:multidrug efflux pump subunit AcrA (membrane-fusion protein)